MNEYLKEIEKAHQTGNATEHTYRPALKDWIETFQKGITATNEPKRIECGAPDFSVSNGPNTIGYIEAKDIGVSLEKEAKSDQMKRYLGGLENLILTNYLEYHWYVEGELRQKSCLGRFDKKQKFKVDKEGSEETEELIQNFLNRTPVQIGDSKLLAERMAGYARLIHESILKVLAKEGAKGELHHQLEAFREVLLRELTQEEFADMYAQTICYGLFAARYNSKSTNFDRKSATWELPKTNPFLSKLFNHIAGKDLDEGVAWAVDDLAVLLKNSDMASIVADFGKKSRREDPVVHFYETFLHAYDPKLREVRGVYYTPEAVVSYIVRSVDSILKKEFSLKKGLADSGKIKISDPESKENENKQIECHKLQILDPATGTGTFLYEVIRQTFQSFSKDKGMWPGYVSQHLLPRLFGFELLMAPYSVAHLKLNLLLEELGYDFKSDERLNVYLTNTLEETVQLPEKYLKHTLDTWLAEEAIEAGRIKNERPIMVILGNPPYSYESENKGKWISDLIRDYYKVDGHPLGERNPKGLQDDYVKFIRFSQWKIDQTGFGVLAFVSNHSYLDNPTFRGMRQSLMQSFDEIYVLDLHGNTKKKEKCPDGSKDENVFDIQQGVAIGIFIKKQTSSQPAKVFHADLWGKRELFEGEKENKKLKSGKYHWLWANMQETTNWEELNPQSPFYYFVSQNIAFLPEFEKGWEITKIMPEHSVGIVTSRDELAIHYNNEEAKKALNEFVTCSIEKARERFDLRKDSRDWKVNLAQNDLKNGNLIDSNFREVLYRPFDIRWTCYTGNSRGFHSMPRPKVMKNMYFDNLALLTSRMTKGENFEHVFVTRFISEKILLSSKTSNNSFHFPLYIYEGSLEPEVDGEEKGYFYKTPNFATDFIEENKANLKLEYVLEGAGDLKKTFGPEDVFFYIYGIFHSPTYRKRYEEFLKRDFPRVPLTANKKLFRELRTLGEEVGRLHLMNTHGPELVNFPVSGNNEVETVSYTEPVKDEPGRVWINKTQYFEGIPPEVWNFYVGGYQVCEKWLKDRKKRTLSYDELEHYKHVVSALSETIRIMGEIDEVIDQHGGWPIQ
ncbi:DNA methyltransferase/helicase [Nitrospina gracilis 3/211]|uniref:site-specific DNA-methyltransferase (adenine-specific) n=1 Tax=Nitrospina gracilis (strain 3/211) TaxID=1266370 RepID=M1Z914_NITG3|nr:MULTISPECIES: type ISP restriction/modification enzyme [Nitrospina]MCF8722663.1 putative helicase [Nitrospina sp. Nb-3]CCQ89600.1 DNA methyltransferase/helicase [Nitrospina gracilis 3/211]